MKWVGVKWERKGKNYQKRIFKAKSPNEFFMFQRIVIMNTEMS